LVSSKLEEFVHNRNLKY